MYNNSDRWMNGNRRYGQLENPYYYPTSEIPTNQMSPFQYYQKPSLPYMQESSTQAGASFKKQNPSLIQYFQTKDGEMDIEKVMSTVNQLASTYQQVSPIFKNVGSLLRNIPK